METIDLTQLESGEQATVVTINGGIGLKRKMEAQGLRVGLKITKITSQFMRGPVTIKIGNTTIAFGYGIAKKIIVKRIDNSKD